MYRSLFLLLFVSLASLTVAQSTGDRAKTRVKQRTERRANQRLDQKIDEGVDKAFNAVEGLFKKRRRNNNDSAATPDQPVREGGLAPNNGEEYEDQEEATAAVLNAIMGGEADDFEPYTNDKLFTAAMEIKETNRRGKTETNRIRLGATRTQTAMYMTDEGQATRIVFDTQTGKTTTVVTDKKGQTQAYRMRMPRIAAGLARDVSADVADDMEQGRYTFERTGQRRTIEGYDCELIVTTDTEEGQVTHAWVTEEVDLTAADMYGPMTSMIGGGPSPVAANMPTAPFQGFPILIETETDGKTFEMRYTDIRIGENRLDRSLFDLSGVDVQEMPGFGG